MHINPEVVNMMVILNQYKLNAIDSVKYIAFYVYDNRTELSFISNDQAYVVDGLVLFSSDGLCGTQNLFSLRSNLLNIVLDG